MKKNIVFPVSAFLFGTLLLAQNRAVMESPIIRSTAEQVSFTARFSDFNPERNYRIGVGTGGADLKNATIQLETESGPLKVELVDFKQGHTGSWWDVPEVAARGFLLSGDMAPADGVLILKFSIPRRDADAIKKIYVFVAKKYGPTTWYLEDGSEVSDEYW